MSKLDLYTNARLQALRDVQDPLADDAVPFLVRHPELAKEINAWENFPDKYPVHFPAPLIRFLDFYKTDPPRLDEKKIITAQNFFSQQGSTYMALLGFYSLPYCYAFADGAQVLVRSKRIMEEQGKRLIETAGFVMECFRPGSFISSDRAKLVIAKVRLIHAFARYFINERATDWQHEWGKPVNQEDMIGTNGAFSFIVARGFRKLRQPLDSETVLALLHYWGIIGYYMGVDITYWPTDMKEANYLDQLIRKRQMKPSKAGEQLIDSLMAHYKETGEPPLTNFMETVVSYFVGEQASNCLGLEKAVSLPPSLFASVLNFNFKIQASKSYSQLEVEFRKIVKQDYGGEATINIPVLPPHIRKNVH